MKFSVVIPARNEEANIRGCLEALSKASESYETETIVVLNRCTDGTEAIAREFGAIITGDHSRNLSKIRNTGARLATGDVLITVDADSRMSPNMFREIDRFISSGRYAGGGVKIVPERMSTGITVSLVLLLPVVTFMGISAGLFWMPRSSFEAVGGFDESVLSAEDIDLARRLKAWGRKRGLRYGTITRAHIRTSCRKFDIFGDWVLLRHPITVWRLLRGRNQELADRFFYRIER